jgi:hypothetical protein|tara:strand:- start:279 stop:806 length:528 start_codon:yes stop_codon:yes gene_type:complete
MEIFKTLSEINVNNHTEKKGKFTYLSWAFAWAELKKKYPTATAKVYHDENTNMPYFASKAGVIVKVGVIVDDLEHINYLPAMDFRNAAILPEKVTMMDINKTIQRCTVKAIALHGLGLYIYAGEDLPEEPEKELPSVRLNNCKSLSELIEVFTSLTRTEKVAMETLKDELKLKLK